MATIHWTDHPEYDQILVNGDRDGLSAREIAETLLVNYGVQASLDQVAGRLRRIAAGAAAPEAQLSPEERFNRAVTAERDKNEQRALAREMGSAIRQQARWQEFLDIVSGELARRPAPPATIEPLVFPVGSGTPEIFTQLIGDIHIGKLVDPNVVGTQFGYGIPIFEARMNRLLNRILRLYELHSATAPFSEIRIYFGGDGVDGVDMRRGQKARVDVQLAVDQALILSGAFEDLLRRLARLGVPIIVIWDFGNHGRVGEFGVNLPADNWDYVAGTFLQLSLRDLPAVQIHLSSLKYHITQLGPMRVHSSHGDAVRGGDGFAGLPINGLARALAKDTGLHKQLFDLYLTAHYHTPQKITTQAGLIWMNGSWDGGDDYSINQLKAASEPVQLAFGVHPENGITWEQAVRLTPERRLPTPAEVL